MAKPTRELESKALKLSPRERARLAQRLISSLEREVDANAEKLWRQEAERRLGEIKSGKVAGIPAEKVIRKARSSLRLEARVSSRSSGRVYIGSPVLRAPSGRPRARLRPTGQSWPARPAPRPPGPPSARRAP